MENLNKFSKYELRKELYNRGLSSIGTKKELLEKLNNFEKKNKIHFINEEKINYFQIKKQKLINKQQENNSFCNLISNEIIIENNNDNNNLLKFFCLNILENLRKGNSNIIHLGIIFF